jgi:hypothetical protein
MRMSSKKGRWETVLVSDTLIPLKELLDRASLISLLKASATSRKRKGDRGKPWHSPLEDLKKCEGETLMSTVKDTL